jgi:phosphatidyl-myo-inositol dimannoside synthase
VYCHYLLSRCEAADIVVVTQAKPETADFDKTVPYEIVRKTYITPLSGGARLKRVWWFIISFPLLLLWVMRYRVSLIHAGTFWPEIVPAWLVSRLTGRPVVVTILGEEITADLYDCDGGWWCIRLLRNLYRSVGIWVLRHCDCVQTISGFSKRALLDRGVPENRIVVITPGIDPAKADAQPAIAADIESRLAGKRIVLTVGRFIRRKGQDMVLRSLPRLRAQFPDLLYVIAGSGLGDERRYYENLIAELKLHDCVVILENLDCPSVAWLYNACDVFIMANRTLATGDTEGYGIVFLEAGAHGKPVVGGRAGGAVDAVDDGVTGLLVDGTSVDEIVSALSRLLSDAQLAKRLGDAGREKFLRNSWDSKAVEYLNLLNRMSGTRSRKG